MSADAAQGRSVRMRSASWIFGSQVLSLVASFPMSILLARALGADGKGTLSVVQLIATFSGVLFNFGIGQAFMYYGARREARGKDAIVLAYTMGIALAAVLGLVSIPAGALIASALHVPSILLVRIGLIATAPVLIAQFLNAYVVGTGAIRNASLVSVGSLFFQLGSMTILLLMGSLNTATAIGVWTVAVTGVALVLTWLTWAGQAEEGVELGPVVLLRRMWRYGMAAWPAGILGNAAQRFDVFLLAYFQGPAAVGVYSIAVTMAELCWYVPNALSGVLIPKVAAEREDGLAITLRLGRVTWVVTAVTGVGVLAVGGPLIPLVFGPDFKASIIPLACILPGIVMSSMSSTPASYLAGIGHPLDMTIAAGVNVAANVAANVVLAPLLGATGAALASTISYTVAAAVIIGYFRHRSGASLRDLLVPQREDFSALYAGAKRALKRG